MKQEGRLLVHAGTFAVLGPGGDVHGRGGSTPDGLFVRDARHLSRWRLTVDGAEPTVLVAAAQDGGVIVVTPAGTRDEPPGCTLFRRQALREGRLTEAITVVSNVARPTRVAIAFHADADFADQFELRSDHRVYDKPGAVRTAGSVPEGVVFDYRRDAWHSSTTIAARPAPVVTQPRPERSERVLTWHLDLPAHGSAELTVTVAGLAHGARRSGGALPDDPAAVEEHVTRERCEFTRDGVPAGPGVTVGDGSDLARACARGLDDLARLLVPATGPDGEEVHVPGAGVPWFLTLFGRDSLLTSYFALPYRPGLAHDTLRALAATQAVDHDPARGAEPGKIVHEIRHGELAHFGQVPYGRYYGSVDSTPLFLVLLHAHAERTGDPALARRLEAHARAAVNWMFCHGGLDAHGYLVYEADRGGLLNQNWKDSAGAVCFRDGTQAAGAIAVSEVQGYAYDALRRTAGLARDVWHDLAWARRLEGAAEALRDRFRADFWMPDADFPALALDGDGRRVDVLASDAGHLLWSGLLDPEDAAAVGRRLLESDFFSGWGIRTLASGQPPYHPLSYHRGSIWPHDNALIVLGLAANGLHEAAATVTAGLLDAAAASDHRLPEVISGYPREGTQGAVPYPHANSPQAWAAATPLALLTATIPPKAQRGQGRGVRRP